MKDKYTISLFLIIPVILFTLSYSLKNYQGAYFTNYDPSYVYLMSSLNLSQFLEVRHVDHPGTPVQVIGAIVIRFYYLFNGHENNMVQDVLLNPEKYLDEIEYTFLIINCLGLFVLGVISYKVYSNVTISFLLQLTPFTSISILSLLTYVRPENFLVFVVSIFIAALILLVNEPNMKTKKYYTYGVLLGIISGLGIATKLTFFPLILIPIVLFRGIKSKLLFLLLISVSFLFFIIPALSSDNINYFVKWVYRLFIHNQKYGRGETTIIDPYNFLSNIKKILFTEWFFDLAYFSICLSLVLCFSPKFKNGFAKVRNIFTNGTNYKLNKSNEDFADGNKCKLILGIFLAMTFQILIVAKHYGNNYMFPSLTISVFAIFTSGSIFSNTFGKKLTKRKMDVIYLMTIFLIAVYGIISFYTYGNQLKIFTEESSKLLNYVEQNSDNSIIVTSYNIPSREYALFIGICYLPLPQVKKYYFILNPKYPSSIYFLVNKCYTFSKVPLMIENTFKSVEKIIFLCSKEIDIELFLELLEKEYGVVNTTYEKKFSSKNGEIYEIKIN